ncbi:MAG TPA: uroporphyrinogen decarboxylase family protein, partial [Candidatus Lokiarchaeia archaeon]
MPKEGLFTTVVGSLPLSNTKENMIKGFEDLINIGIDYPCYPQLESMITQFLRPLSKKIDKLYEKNNKFYLNDDFILPDKPVALEYGNFMKEFFNERPSLKDNVRGLKACLTGPFTLASEIILEGNAAKGIKPRLFNEPRGIMLEWIVDKFADIMKQIGKAYNDLGIDIISMDEPILGLLVGKKTWFYSNEFIIQTLNKAISGIKKLSSIHVCGAISPNLRDILLQTDVKILDHEFRTNENNFKIFEKKHFENSDKFLAMGSIQTKIAKKENLNREDYIESVDFLKDYVKKG